MSEDSEHFALTPAFFFFLLPRPMVLTFLPSTPSFFPVPVNFLLFFPPELGGKFSPSLIIRLPLVDSTRGLRPRPGSNLIAPFFPAFSFLSRSS